MEKNGKRKPMKIEEGSKKVTTIKTAPPPPPPNQKGDK